MWTGFESLWSTSMTWRARSELWKRAGRPSMTPNAESNWRPSIVQFRRFPNRLPIGIGHAPFRWSKAAEPAILRMARNGSFGPAEAATTNGFPPGLARL